MLAALSSSAIRLFWVLYKCNTQLMVRVPFPGSGRVWNLLVADHSVPAWLAFIKIMERHGYLFRESAGGTYNCRPVNHNPSNPYSIHSYGLAVDLNPSKNPQGTKRTDMPAGLIADVKALRTTNGRPLFVWGGDWSGSASDPMHFQIAATPADIATGIVGSTPEPDQGATDIMAFLPLRQSENRKSDNALVAELLNAAYSTGLPTNGTWDDSMTRVIKTELAPGSPDLDGTMVTGQMFGALLVDVARRQGASSGTVPRHEHTIKTLIVE